MASKIDTSTQNALAALHDILAVLPLAGKTRSAQGADAAAAAADTDIVLRSIDTLLNIAHALKEQALLGAGRRGSPLEEAPPTMGARALLGEDVQNVYNEVNTLLERVSGPHNWHLW